MERLNNNLRKRYTGGRSHGILDSGEYVGVVVTGHHPQQAGWVRPATFFFRRAASGWTLVGIERGEQKG